MRNITVREYIRRLQMFQHVFERENVLQLNQTKTQTEWTKEFETWCYLDKDPDHSHKVLNQATKGTK
jgi:hypothetical protein